MNEGGEQARRCMFVIVYDTTPCLKGGQGGGGGAGRGPRGQKWKELGPDWPLEEEKRPAGGISHDGALLVEQYHCRRGRAWQNDDGALLKCGARGPWGPNARQPVHPVTHSRVLGLNDRGGLCLANQLMDEAREVRGVVVHHREIHSGEIRENRILLFLRFLGQIV